MALALTVRKRPADSRTRDGQMLSRALRMTVDAMAEPERRHQVGRRERLAQLAVGRGLRRDCGRARSALFADHARSASRRRARWRRPPLPRRATTVTAVVACVWASPLLAQTQRAATFQLVDVSCTRVETGPTKYPDPTRPADVAKFTEVFGEGVKAVGVVGRKDGGWRRLPRFWASLKAWPPNGQPAHPISSYSLRAPDPEHGGELYVNVNAVALNLFSHGNPEVLLKVFVGAPYGYGLHAWIYAAAATDLPMELRVWDVVTRRLVVWRKAAGPAVALTDTTTMLGSDCFACGQDPYC